MNIGFTKRTIHNKFIPASANICPASGPRNAKVDGE